ncbi:alpha/beta fold hydrolase [Desulfoluna spongiiphila]|uniref:Pimeloyl-ACP methyl ester carboxylesterase n=1 Tax=Desulfoluna spongiiphila TaxID=419481 RepID=A0A1G5GC98_9BACT|nr:alpha/beta hydrolase [Desulfoluna spongiiphila]SCY49226.1 Pimeloyl-ACP methyl ester carboxylesterase [Desulfoluna spongiiphila]
MKEFPIDHMNARIRYHDFPGEETPILFIHGLGCASSLDYPQVASMPHLAGHRRILIDLLGAGYSDKPDHFGYSLNDHVDYLEAFVRFLDVDRFIVYGHSMGGAIAISLAARCGKQLKGVILSEANLDSGGGYYSKKIASYGEEEYVAGGHAEMIRENKGSPNENWTASLLVSSPEAVYKESICLVEGQNPSWRQLLYSLEAPKTYIFGEKSLPDPDVETLKKEQIHLEIVEGAGHAMAWDNPKGLAAAIKRGIDRIMG